MEHYPAVLRPLAYKFLVTVALLSPEMEIAMRNGELFSASVCQLGHAHRIYAAADSKKG